MTKDHGAGGHPGQETWQRCLFHRYYHSRPDWVTGTERFRALLEESLTPGGSILEIGAGPANATTDFLAGLGTVTGLDVDPDVAGNAACSETQLYDGGAFPLADARFDAVVSNYVLEHVENPGQMAAECFRVLRPGGVVAFRTPNLWHYVSLIARFTPHSFHERVALKSQNVSEDAHDPYPTFHRMNTRAACRAFLEGAGFEVEVLNCIEPEPAYGQFSRLAFYPMMLWERVLNSTDRLEGLRSNILCVARRPG